jgi:hypothetical protein
MPDPDALAESRARALAAGLGPQDLAWLDGLGWKDSAVPEIKGEAVLADYQRREKALASAVAHLTFAERADSPEGKLAAALGAKIADWADKDDADAD